LTISTTTIKNSYSGNNSTSAFNYTFKISAESEMQVIIRSASGTETVKSLTTHYTISGVGNSNGGTVTFTSGNIPASGETVVLRRDTAQTQEMDLIDNDPMSAETIETAHDKSIALIQELQEENDRSIKISRTNTMTSTEFTVDAAARANKILAFDSAGEIAVTQELGTYKGNWAASTSYAVRDLVKDTSTNNIFIALTAHTSSGSQPLTTNTDSAKWSLLVDAASATTSQTAAAASATAASNSQTAAASSASAASTSETNAANSASTASTQATNASNSATAAASSATAAAGSASAAAATFDLFDDSYLGAKSSNPSVDNDGNALQDGALIYHTGENVMKVYDLGTTTWLQLTPTVSNQNNINSAVANSANINSAVANESNINAAVANESNINSAVSNASNITNVASNSAAIVAVNNNQTNINAVNSNSANINLTAGSITNVNNVGSNIANVNTAATNLTSINSFANTYLGPSASAPTQDPDGSSLDQGDLYFSTSDQSLKVYGSSGWQNAGSSVNGTSARFKYTATAGQTTFTGNDDNSNNLSFDPGFADCYLNGVKLVRTTDYVDTSGSSIVLQGSGAALNDTLEIVAFGTFNVAAIDAGNISSGTLNNSRLSSDVTQNTATQTLTNKTLAAGSNTISGLTNSNLSGSAAISNANLANSSITINGSAVSLGGSVTISAGTDWQSVKTSNFTAVAGEGYPVDTTSTAITVTFPASASVGDTIVLLDYARTFGTNKLTINQNSLNFQGATVPNPEYNTNGQSITCTYIDATKGWIPTVDDDVTYETPPPTLTNISGSITVGLASSLTLTGTEFGTANLVVNFLQTADSIDENVTVTPSSTTSATVAVPAAVYNNVTAGNAVTIKVTNSLNAVSNTLNTNAVALPTGGTISSHGSYRVHTFTSSDNFVVPTGFSKSMDTLIVAGGGAGGNWHAGGGGAGGMITYNSTPSAATYPVVVGAGGAGGYTSVGSQGASSSVFSQSTVGGGRGGNYNSTSAGSGGSGAGGNGSGLSSPGSGTSGQGNSGGSGSGNHGGGGGGGKGASGSSSPNTNTGGNGGIGGQNDYRTGSNEYYAGGGGGGTWGGGSRAPGGNGGGGLGSSNQNSTPPTAGTANTGGGGGGNGGQGNAANRSSQTTGGSGIVVIRYAV
jgi:hypothetical protein